VISRVLYYKENSIKQRKIVMCVQKQITQSHVMLENGTEYILEYHIFSENAQDDDTFYGVKITQHSGGSITSESARISSDEEYATQTILLFAKNFVFPGSLHDLIEDMRDDSIIGYNINSNLNF